jgi:acetylornithine/succinyldiaminopimelate/putrescine aminotransferase
VDEEGDTQAIRYGVLKDFKRALDLYGENVAAFLVEPIQGEAGYAHFAKYMHDFFYKSKNLS